jgi:hypothetical protein
MGIKSIVPEGGGGGGGGIPILANCNILEISEKVHPWHEFGK